MQVIAYCETCAHKHPIDFDPAKPDDQFRDWTTKHHGHYGVGFIWPERTTYAGWMERLIKPAWRFAHSFVERVPSISAIPQWRGALRTPDAVAAFLDNADVKEAFGTTAAIAGMDLASLASSSSKLAGRESDAVDNSTNKYLDFLLAGYVKVGTTPTTATSIDVCVVGMQDDSVWPDVFDGTGSAETVTNAEIKDQICKPFQTISVISTTTGVVYYYGPGSVASRFGGVVGKKFVVFVAHNTVAALDSTTGNHVSSITPTYLTVI